MLYCAVEAVDESTNSQISATVRQTTVPDIHKGPWRRPSRTFIDLVLNLLKVDPSCGSKTQNEMKIVSKQSRRYIFLPVDPAEDGPRWSWRNGHRQTQHPGDQTKSFAWSVNIKLDGSMFSTWTPNSNPVFPQQKSSHRLCPSNLLSTSVRAEFPLLSWPERHPVCFCFSTSNHQGALFQLVLLHPPCHPHAVFLCRLPPRPGCPDEHHCQM